MDDVHPRRLRALFVDEPLAHALANRDDGVGVAQQRAIQPIERAVHEPVMESSSSCATSGKTSSQRNNESRARPPRGRQRQASDDRWIGQRHDDVRAADLQARQRRGGSVGQVVGRPRPRIVSTHGRARGPQDRHAVVLFALHRPEAGAARVRRVERGPGDDRNLATEARDEIFAQFGEQLTGRRLVRPVRAVEEADLMRGE